MSALAVLLKTGLVFGLLAGVLFMLKKTDSLGARGRGGLLEVRGSTRLGKGATLTAVRVDGRDLLLGVTDHTVTLLTSEPTVTVREQVPTTTKVPPLRAVLDRFAARPAPGSVAPEAIAAALAKILPGTADGTVVPHPRTDAHPAEEQPCADPAVA